MTHNPLFVLIRRGVFPGLPLLTFLLAVVGKFTTRRGARCLRLSFSLRAVAFVEGFVNVEGGLFAFLPVTGHEEEEDGEDFQTPYQHIETHQPLAEGRNAGKVTGRTCHSCTRTYVA